MAVPAYPGKMPHRQPDGTVISVYMRGDEWGHILLSEDGYPLVQGKSGALEYAELRNGKLAPSGVAATNANNHSAAAKSLLSTINKQQLTEAAYSSLNKTHAAALTEVKRITPAKAIGDTRLRISDVPTIGRHKSLIILVNFSDRKFSESDPAEYYDRFFNEKGFSDYGATGSALDYYHASSDNNFDPDFVIVGPVTVSGTAASYGGGDHTQDAWKMVQEACQEANSQVDFSEFDTDGDGYCDNVYVIYAGYGYADTNGNYGDCIWPHNFYLNQGSGDRNHSITLDGVTINRYTASQELNGADALQGKGTIPEGIGTFCHEYAHVLGLPDLYATNNSNTGPDYWSVMAVGCYSNDSRTPPVFSSYERYALGWINPTTFAAGTDTITTLPALSDNNSALLIQTGTPNEYFLLENRQQKGWDTYLAGHGLLVWHVTEDYNKWTGNTVNNDPNHQYVDIVEAAGANAGAPFPGQGNVTSRSFSDWNNNHRFNIIWLSEHDGLVSMLRDSTAYHLPQPQLTIDNIKGITADASWTEVRLQPEGSSTWTPVDGYDFEVLSDNDSIIFSRRGTQKLQTAITGLEPEKEYTAEVTARFGELKSLPKSVTFTTLARQIEETKVNAGEAENVSSTGFKAVWDNIPDADSYIVNLYRHTNGGRKEIGTGFDGFTPDNPQLPAGWTTNTNAAADTHNFGDAAPALTFDTDGDNLVITNAGSKIYSLRFWHRSTNSDNHLIVEEHANGSWTTIDDFKTNANAKQISTCKVDGADSVRIVLQRAGGRAQLDDVYATFDDELFDLDSTVTVTADGEPQGSYTFTSLDPTESYSYNVQAREGDRLSLVSDYINVDLSNGGTTGINVPVATSDVPKVIYDLSGRRLKKISAPGVYIVNGRKEVVK